MEEKSRIRWLDTARGYGILLVIFAHVDYSFLRGIIYTFHMPLFFFLSGYVFSRKETFGQFVKGKIRRILVPYFCLGIPMLIFDVFLQRRFQFFSVLLARQELIALLEQRRLWTLWYIACLFWLNILFYGLVTFVKNEKVLAAVTVILAVVGLVYYALGGDALYWNVDVCLTALPFFYAGYMCRKKQIPEKYIFPAKHKMLLGMGAFLIVILSMILNQTFAGDHLEMFYNHYGIAPVTYLGAFAGILMMLLFANRFAVKPACYLGENSILYYAWHQTILIPLLDGLYMKLGISQLPTGSLPYFCRGILSVVVICVVLTAANKVMHCGVLKVALGEK